MAKTEKEKLITYFNTASETSNELFPLDWNTTTTHDAASTTPTTSKEKILGLILFVTSVHYKKDSIKKILFLTGGPYQVLVIKKFWFSPNSNWLDKMATLLSHAQVVAPDRFKNTLFYFDRYMDLMQSLIYEDKPPYNNNCKKFVLYSTPEQSYQFKNQFVSPNKQTYALTWSDIDHVKVPLSPENLVNNINLSNLQDTLLAKVSSLSSGRQRKVIFALTGLLMFVTWKYNLTLQQLMGEGKSFISAMHQIEDQQNADEDERAARQFRRREYEQHFQRRYRNQSREKMSSRLAGGF